MREEASGTLVLGPMQHLTRCQPDTPHGLPYRGQRARSGTRLVLHETARDQAFSAALRRDNRTRRGIEKACIHANPQEIHGRRRLPETESSYSIFSSCPTRGPRIARSQEIPKRLSPASVKFRPDPRLPDHKTRYRSSRLGGVHRRRHAVITPSPSARFGRRRGVMRFAVSAHKTGISSDVSAPDAIQGGQSPTSCPRSRLDAPSSPAGRETLSPKYHPWSVRAPGPARRRPPVLARRRRGREHPGHLRHLVTGTAFRPRYSSISRI